MTQRSLAVQPLWRQFSDLPYDERLTIYDDALMYRQIVEAMDWYPVLETTDEYQIRVWSELEL